MRHIDTAIVNVPLAKRGDIDAQIDRYKREQAAKARRDAKTKAAERKQDKATAKALLAKHLDSIVAKHAAAHGEKALRDMLDDFAKWQPKKLIAVVNKFQAETAA